MPIKLHENGWTGILEDFQFAHATQEEINEIGKFVASNTLIVARDQKLSAEDELKVCSMFGNLEHVTFTEKNKHLNSILIPEGQNKIVRVTGELDEHGQPGLFGHVSDLDWHCNRTGDPNRKPIVWLYGVRGTQGSKTSWNNGILAWNDLTDEQKSLYKDLQMICGWRRGNYTEFDMGVDEEFNEHNLFPLYYTSEFGTSGLFFPFLQFRNFVGYTENESIELSKPLIDHVLQEKYLYHHYWQDGDVIISDQWFGIHKRWNFENMHNRMLHRITFDYANITV